MIKQQTEQQTKVMPDTQPVSFSPDATTIITRSFPKPIQDNDNARINWFIKQTEKEFNRYLAFRDDYKYELNDFILNREALIKKARTLQRAASKILTSLKEKHHYNPDKQRRAGWNQSAEYQLCQLADQAETGARIWIDTHSIPRGRYSPSSKDIKAVLKVMFQTELDRFYSIATGKFPDNLASAPSRPFDFSASVSGFNKVWNAIRKTNLIERYAPELHKLTSDNSGDNLYALRKQKQRRVDFLKYVQAEERRQNNKDAS